jgi:peptidoglycan/xylan/chitin deacetylase (PgdA/CDA1 family)
MISRKIHNLLHPKLGKILMLHSVSSSEYLASLVAQCQKEGFKPVSLDEAVERLKKRNGGKFSCFTFDDGYLDTYTIAFPTLKKFDVPFCVYMTRDFYRGTARPVWDASAQMMNVAQLKEMSESPLCTIGGHTCTHPHLSTFSADTQLHEIADCKADLEDLLGKKVLHFAYPHGDYNQTTVKIVSELGFVTAVTTSGRHVRDDLQLLELDRVFNNASL